MAVLRSGCADSQIDHSLYDVRVLGRTCRLFKCFQLTYATAVVHRFLHFVLSNGFGTIVRQPVKRFVAFSMWQVIRNRPSLAILYLPSVCIHKTRCLVVTLRVPIPNRSDRQGQGHCRLRSGGLYGCTARPRNTAGDRVGLTVGRCQVTASPR